MHSGHDHAYPGGSSGGVSARLAQFNKSTSLEESNGTGQTSAADKDPAVFFDGSMVGSVAVGRAQQHVRHRRRATHLAVHLLRAHSRACTHPILTLTLTLTLTRALTLTLSVSEPSPYPNPHPHPHPNSHSKPHPDSALTRGFHSPT